MLAQPVSLRTVLLAKVIARAGLLLLATMLISLAALSAEDEDAAPITVLMNWQAAALR